MGSNMLAFIVATAGAAGATAAPLNLPARCSSLVACVSACPAGDAFAACLADCNAACPKPTSALFIGNSLTFWNGGTENIVQGLAAAAGYDLEVAACTIGGATLGTLWRRTNNVNGCPSTTPRAAVQTGDYDVVVMQEDMPELVPRTVPEVYLAVGAMLIAVNRPPHPLIPLEHLPVEGSAAD